MLNFDTSSSSSSSSEDEEIIIRRPKIYRSRKNYFEIYDELDFFDRFRLTKAVVQGILQEIGPMIKLRSNRGGCIQPVYQLLLTLRFYATGNMQISVADFIGVSKSSACRIIKRVSIAIASLKPRYIKMCENGEEMRKVAEEFYSIASFPKIIGAIDCTLIKIESPGGEDAEIFRSRKSFFAINVQTISDAKLRIRNIVARWPGSVHDQTIFNNSKVKRKFENGDFEHFILVGDSGYSLQRYLMTKLQEPTTPSENLYNESIIRTRNVVERQYGVWKRRFPILSLGMRMKLDTVLSIIVATAVLHNIAIDAKEDIPQDWLQIEQEDELFQQENNTVNMGRHFRQLLIDEHFGQL